MALAPRTALVVGAVQLDHRVVDFDLVFGIEAADGFVDFAVDEFDGALDTLAEVTRAAVAQFDSLMGAGGRAGGKRGAAEAAVFQMHVDFHGRVARLSRISRPMMSMMAVMVSSLIADG